MVMEGKLTPEPGDVWLLKDRTGEQIFARLLRSSYTIGGIEYVHSYWEVFGGEDGVELDAFRLVRRILTASELLRPPDSTGGDSQTATVGAVMGGDTRQQEGCTAVVLHSSDHQSRRHCTLPVGHGGSHQVWECIHEWEGEETLVDYDG